MGGEEKETSQSKPPPTRKSRAHGVLDTAFSKLLQDFTNAELFPHRLDHQQTGAGACSGSSCDDIASSLKHLHLRKPIVARHREHRRRALRRRHSLNSLNLAVASGNFQKAVVWPSRLGTTGKREGPYALRPSQLRVTSNTSCSSGTSLHDDKKDKVPQVSETVGADGKIKKPEHMAFEKYSSKSLVPSFSSLCEQASHKGSKQKHPSDGSAAGEDPAVSASALQTKRHSTSCIPPAKFARTEVEAVDIAVSSPLVFSGYRNPGASSREVSQMPGDSYSSDIRFDSCINSSRGIESRKQKHPVSDPISARAPEGAQFSASTLRASSSSVATSNTLVQAATRNIADSSVLSRSCSQEMRMEETNVNELSSYFEDLVYIPRKMSTMAEMMYA